jgi:hypothetical protein
MNEQESVSTAGGYGPPGNGGGGFNPPPAGFGGPPPGGFGAPPQGGAPPGAFGPPPGPFGPAGPFGPMGALPPSNGLATGAMILGVLALPGACCCYSSLPLGLAAIVMGVIAVNKAKTSPITHGGRVMAQAGIICGAVGLALTIAIILMGVGMQLANGVQHRMGF